MPHAVKRPSVVAFDIIETTFRIEPLDGPLVALGLPAGTYRRLYVGTLRDAFALACTGRFAPFLTVMKAELAGLLAEHGIDAPEPALDEALSIMRRLPPQPDAKASFERLHDAGIVIVALSNGAAAATRALFEGAGMTDLVQHVLSIDDVRLSKPRAEVYRHAVQVAGVAAADVMMVACHPWDVAAAKAAGLLGGYVARERPYPVGLFEAPEIEGASLAEVADAILRMPSG